MRPGEATLRIYRELEEILWPDKFDGAGLAWLGDWIYRDNMAGVPRVDELAKPGGAKLFAHIPRLIKSLEDEIREISEAHEGPLTVPDLEQIEALISNESARLLAGIERGEWDDMPESQRAAFERTGLC